jgi:hypothetical protein
MSALKTFLHVAVQFWQRMSVTTMYPQSIAYQYVEDQLQANLLLSQANSTLVLNADEYLNDHCTEVDLLTTRHSKYTST